MTKRKTDNTIIASEDVVITDKDIEKALKIINSKSCFNDKFFVKPRKSDNKKYYDRAYNGWDCKRLILRVDGKDYVREFEYIANIGKWYKIGQLTKYTIDKCGKIKTIIEGQHDLIFELEPINI